jgi:hypothetical protein
MVVQALVSYRLCCFTLVCAECQPFLIAVPLWEPSPFWDWLVFNEFANVLGGESAEDILYLY